MFDFIISAGQRPDPVIFTSMIDEYCLVAKMEKAFRVVDTMVSVCMSTNVIPHDLFLSMVMLSLS